MDFRPITREELEDARQVAREIAKTKQYEISMKLRKKVEMLFAHLKRILGLGRLRLQGPYGASDEFLLAATAQNLRKLANMILIAGMPGEIAKALLMAAGWVINLAVAEWIIRRRPVYQNPSDVATESFRTPWAAMGHSPCQSKHE